MLAGEFRPVIGASLVDAVAVVLQLPANVVGKVAGVLVHGFGSTGMRTSDPQRQLQPEQVDFNP